MVLKRIMFPKRITSTYFNVTGTYKKHYNLLFTSTITQFKHLYYVYVWYRVISYYIGVDLVKHKLH